MQKKSPQKNTKQGFTLLFAVLVSTLVLAVGASIINIALKQVVLSGVGRESQYAFYAANTGIECAYYWDLAGFANRRVFATSTISLEPPEGEIFCAGIDIIADGDGAGNLIDYPGNKFHVNSFELDFESEEEGISSCAKIFVKKEILAGGIASTTIESRGYNTCDTENPRRIERGLELYY